MLDTISAHIEFIEGNNILREVITNSIVCAEFTIHRFFRCQQIRDLDIQFLAAFVAYKVDFFITCSADSDLVVPAQQFQIHDILQDEIDVPHISAENSLADAVISNIILLVGSEDLLALQIFSLHLIKQISLAAVFDIVQDRFWGDGALLAFQKLCKRSCGEGCTDIGDHISNNSLQQIDIPDFISLHDVLELDGVE